jgi:hypothetical protein
MLSWSSVCTGATATDTVSSSHFYLPLEVGHLTSNGAQSYKDPVQIDKHIHFYIPLEIGHPSSDGAQSYGDLVQIQSPEQSQPFTWTHENETHHTSNGFASDVMSLHVGSETFLNSVLSLCCDDSISPQICLLQDIGHSRQSNRQRHSCAHVVCHNTIVGWMGPVISTNKTHSKICNHNSSQNGKLCSCNFRIRTGC